MKYSHSVTRVIFLILGGIFFLSSCGVAVHETNEAWSSVTVQTSSDMKNDPLMQSTIQTTETDPASQTAQTVVTTASATMVTETELPVQTEQTTAETTTATVAETTAAPTLPVPLPYDGRRDELFATRTRTPRVVVLTAGELTYTVTFDREAYYYGDDINIRIRVENTGERPVVLVRTPGDPLQNCLTVDLCLDGMWIGEREIHPVWAKSGAADRIYYWEPGAVEEMTGRLPTYREAISSRHAMLLSINRSHFVELPMVSAGTVPDDNELLPYLTNGDISEGLYRRVRVMNDTETVPILLSNGWRRSAILPGEAVQPVPETYGLEKLGYDWAVVWLTRDQLLTMLEHQAPMKTASRKPLRYIYETEFGELVNLMRVYPVDGVS